MHLSSKDTIRVIKERLNIVDVVRRYVELKPNGHRWVAPCPFHQETKPSFSVNEEMGMFYCFGCHASGDVFDFYSRINGLNFKETLEQLAAEAGINLSHEHSDSQYEKNRLQERSLRQQIIQLYAFAANHFVQALHSSEAEECRAYIAKRGLSDDIVQRFGLGWACREWQSLVDALRRAGVDTDMAVKAGLVNSSKRGRIYDCFRGRLIFPIKSLSNHIIAFGGRIIRMEQEAKYINSPDTPIYKKGEHLYGLAQARRGITTKGRALLTEGYMDVLTLHQFGYDNAVGVLGTSLTQDQIKRLSGFTSQFILLFDGDRAGRKAALRSCELLLTRGLSCKVVLMPEGEDIDSFLRNQGQDAFELLQSQAPDGLCFCVDVLKALAPRETVEWARNFLLQVKVPELVSPYISQLAVHLQLSEADLRQGISNERIKHGRKGISRDTGSLSRQNIRDREIMMFAVRYPHRMADVQSLGADLALRSDVARRLWDKLEATSSDEVFQELDQREKNFWSLCRGPEAPPRNDNGDKELASLRRSMDNYYRTAQSSSLAAALRANINTGDFEADLDYLRALKETLENGHEQS